MWPGVIKWTIPCPETRMSAYTYMLAKPFISVVGNEIFCGWLFQSQDKIGNNISQLAGKPLRLSVKNTTGYKLLLKCNLKTNSEKPLLTLWQSPPCVLSSHPISAAYSTASAAPLSSFPTISHWLFLPIRLLVGGALEKVVHFWISGFFEV